MNIIIGVRDTARELHIDAALDEDALARRVDEAVAQGGVLDLTDAKGQRYLVPGRSIGFVHVPSDTERRVGFAIN